jgi:hypothetical protein
MIWVAAPSAIMPAGPLAAIANGALHGPLLSMTKLKLAPGILTLCSRFTVWA